MTRSPRRPAPAARLAVAVPLLAVALAACGGSGSSTATAPAGGTGGAARPSGAPSGSGQRAQPGVSGQTAEISGDTLQVRTAEGQTAVQFTGTTRITQVKAATASAVKVGSCLVATGQPDAAGTGLAAQTVTVSEASGGCTAEAGRGFGGGGFGGGAGRGTRTAPPGGQGGGGQNAPGQGGAPATPVSTAFGTVTAVTPTSVTVQGLLRTFRGPRNGSPGASPTGSPAAVAVTVTLAPTTRFTDTVTVASSALAVGQCVTALGQANDIGVVAARAITIRPAGADGSCTTGFGGFGGRRGNGNGTGNGGPAATQGTTNG